jgi:hypothetical protein
MTFIKVCVSDPKVAVERAEEVGEPEEPEETRDLGETGETGETGSLSTNVLSEGRRSSTKVAAEKRRESAISASSGDEGGDSTRRFLSFRIKIFPLGSFGMEAMK